MSTFLTDLELEQLTGKKQPAAQRRALERVGIHYIPRADGRPVVQREDIRPQGGKAARASGFDLAALDRLG